MLGVQLEHIAGFVGDEGVVGPGEWTSVFADARLAKAVIDRLTHHAHIIDTGTESWRFNHGLKTGARRKRRTPAK